MVFAIHHLELAAGIHVFPPHPEPSSPYPSGLSLSTSFGCPASCTGHLFYIWHPIIQNEVSHKKKDKYCISTHIYGI